MMPEAFFALYWADYTNQSNYKQKKCMPIPRYIND